MFLLLKATSAHNYPITFYVANPFVTQRYLLDLSSDITFTSTILNEIHEKSDSIRRYLQTREKVTHVIRVDFQCISFFRLLIKDKIITILKNVCYIKREYHHNVIFDLDL